jgi:hypothetical protein
VTDRDGAVGATAPPAREPEPPAPSGLVRRIVRGLVLAALLLAPSIALERWARGETDLIAYFQDGYRYQLDAKQLMFQHVDCPAAVTMGTSMTEGSLNAGSIEPYSRTDRSFSPIFAFAAPGTRPLAMLGLWRWIADSGCVPRTLFVEVTPVILNIARGEDFERPFMDWRMQLDIPEERFARDPYTIRYRFELATWWRSFVYRNREPILKYLSARLGKGKRLPPVDPIPSDGKLYETSTAQLAGPALEAHYRETRRTFEKGEFKYVFSPSYTEAIRLLVEEAAAAGTRVVLHTPPMLFHETMEMIGATKPFCDFYDEMTARGGVTWYSEYRREVPSTDFFNWLHVNRGGAERYAARLLAAVATNNVPRERCR